MSCTSKAGRVVHPFRWLWGEVLADNDRFHRSTGETGKLPRRPDLHHPRGTAENRKIAEQSRPVARDIARLVLLSPRIARLQWSKHAALVAVGITLKPPT